MKNITQKLEGLFLIIIGLLSLAVLQDGTFLVFTLIVGISLILSKKNYSDFEIVIDKTPQTRYNVGDKNDILEEKA